MPVVAVTHVPTLDGINIDKTEANYTYRPPEWTTDKVADVLTYATLLSTRTKYFLEERSRFRGYKNPSSCRPTWATASWRITSSMNHYLYRDE